MFRRLCFPVFLLLGFQAILAAVTLDTGEIDGARFTIARPAHWNHCLLLLAHGYRPESAPLVADLDPGQDVCRTLLDAGWMVATTSYRRNGLILTDAIADLDALHAYIAKTYEPPARVLLEGEDMGGTIVTLMAEHDDSPYSGAIAIGTTFDVRESNERIGLTLQPKIPLIFLATQTELSGPRRYLNTRVPHDKADPRPVIFFVARDGRANVKQRERLAGLRALVIWLERGPGTLPHPAAGEEFFDATSLPVPQPSQVTFAPDGHSFDARVTEISAFTGNLTINAQPEDFARLGLGKSSRFQLATHKQTFRVHRGRDFDSVKRGEWVALPNADGFFWLARNHASAADTAQVTVGDTVTIRSFDEPPAPEN